MSDVGTPSTGNTLVGRVLDDRYVLRSVLGVGGMGTVFRAEQLSMGRDVAIKVLRTDMIHDEQAVRRFLTEARAASRLKSPHTVSVFDFGRTADGVLYLVMELLEGRTLGDAMEQEKRPMALDRAVRLVHQVLDALEEAHGQGILHRDLKPDNVFLLEGANGREFVKVLDFGVAKMLFDPRPGQTVQGVTFGTMEYMSPEQMLGRDLGPSSDLYEVAILLFQMVCGKLPFEGNNPVEIALRKIEGPIPTPRDLLPTLPPSEALEEFFRVALAPSPEDRYPDVETFRAALKLTARSSIPERLAARGPGDTERDLSPSDGALDTWAGVPMVSDAPTPIAEGPREPAPATVAMAPFGKMDVQGAPAPAARSPVPESPRGTVAMAPFGQMDTPSAIDPVVPAPPPGGGPIPAPAPPSVPVAVTPHDVPGQDRRRRPRKPHLLSVLCVHEGARHKALLAEVSLGGAFVHSRWLPVPGAEVAIVFPRLVEEGHPTVVIRSQVLRRLEFPQKPGEVQGFSVRFLTLRTQGALAHLKHFFRHHFRFELPTDLPEDRQAALWEWSFESQTLRGVDEA